MTLQVALNRRWHSYGYGYGRAHAGGRRKCICADDFRPSAGHYGAFVSTQKPQTSIDDVARERSREAEINLATTYSS